MSNVFIFLVLGLGTGAVYAGMATSLLAVFKATGIINFAQGAMAIWGAYVVVGLRADGQLVLPVGSIDLGGPTSLVVALMIGLICAALIGWLAHVLVFRPLRHAPPLAQVVASVGVMLTLQALVVLRFGPNSMSVKPVLPTGTVELFGTTVSGTALLLTAIVLAIATAMWAYFRFTTIGLATRAASENERATMLSGFSPERLAAVTWVGATTICTFVVILASPVTGLNPSNYTLFIIPALGCALVGQFRSIGVTCATAFGLGAFQSIVTYFTTQSWWPSWAVTGIQDAVPFIVIIVAMMLVGDKLPMRGTLVALRLPRVVIPRIRPGVAVVALAVVIALLLVTSGSYRFGIITSLVLGLLSLSFVVLTGYLGQISLAQAAFAGASGFALSKLTTNLGLPFPIDLLAAALVAMLLGLIVAIPALRIRGTQLAVVTLAAAVAIQAFVFSNPSLTPTGGNPIKSPELLGLDLAVRGDGSLARMSFALMVLVLLTLVMIVLVRLFSGVTGRAFLAVRSNERAAAAAGVNVAVTKIIGFGIAAFIAGIGGALIGYSRGQLSVESFTVFVGLSLLAFAYLGGITSIFGAVVAGVLGPLGIVYVLLDNAVGLGDYYALVSGVGLVLTAVLNPTGITGVARETVERLGRRRATSDPGSPAPPSGPNATSRTEHAHA